MTLFFKPLTAQAKSFAMKGRVKYFFRALNQVWQKIPSRTYAIIFTAVTVLLIIVLTQLLVDEDNAPCSSTQYLGECYDVPRTLCETALATIQTSCESQVKKVTKPGQLVGPIVRNCEQLKFDRILKYTRKSKAVCIDRINYLESWQKGNTDF